MPQDEIVNREAINGILELARWAPSGDNTQPWRFEILDDLRLVVHGFDTRRHCVYDLDGRASQIAQGALLETIRIAATAYGLAAHILRTNEPGGGHVDIEVAFTPDRETTPNPLLSFIITRCTQRRAMSTTPLAENSKRQMEQDVGPEHDVIWFEGLRTRARFAALMIRNGRLRLTLPEAYRVHRDVIEWGATVSVDRIPERAVGVDPVTATLMRWALRSWKRVEFMNRYLGGTLVPGLQLDLIPGLACGAHFAILSKSPLARLDDYLAGGSAMQRLWLSAARAGLQVQPEMTPIIFSRYVRELRAFTTTRRLQASAEQIARRLSELMPGRPLDRVVFMGRIGAGKPAVSRSTRLPLQQLLLSENVAVRQSN